ncbi:uncharacterized protein LOC142564948 [Dermacentor variabilis]|uniref:uncharacterized protein LOC142564948 n=1 Tax=Dermacentor variabilis TaxID=34621 RepID=UPI003F5BAA20
MDGEDSLPPKKAWLKRKQELARPPRIPSEDSNEQEAQSNPQISPEATVSAPSCPEPALRTQERSRITGSDEARRPLPGRQNVGTSLQAGCFKAFRNALHISVINFVGSRRKRASAGADESVTLSNPVPTDRAAGLTQRDDDDNSEGGARRRSLNPGPAYGSGDGTSPRKRASPAAEETTTVALKSGVKAPLQEASAAEYFDISGQKERSIRAPSQLDLVSEETVDYRIKAAGEHGQPWFRLPKAHEPLEPQRPPSSTSQVTVDVDKLLMPPPPVPWGRKITGRKERQPALDSTSQIPSYLFSADHFQMVSSEESQRTTSTQPSRSQDVAPQSSSTPTQAWDFGSKGEHQQPHNVSSDDHSAEAREQEQPDPSNQPRSLLRACLLGQIGRRSTRRSPALSTSDQPAELGSRSVYQRSERHASSQYKGEPSSKAPQELASFRKNRDADRTAVDIREGRANVQENPPEQDVRTADVTVRRDPGCRKSGESAASQAICSEKDKQECGENTGAATERGKKSVQEGSTKESAIDMDSTDD